MPGNTPWAPGHPRKCSHEAILGYIVFVYCVYNRLHCLLYAIICRPTWFILGIEMFTLILYCIQRCTLFIVYYYAGTYSQDFWFGGPIWANLGWSLSEKKSIKNTVTHYFFGNKYNKKHKSNPKRAKRANVWGSPPPPQAHAWLRPCYYVHFILYTIVYINYLLYTLVYTLFIV